MMISFYQMVHHHTPSSESSWHHAMVLFDKVRPWWPKFLAMGRTTHFGWRRRRTTWHYGLVNKPKNGIWECIAKKNQFLRTISFFFFTFKHSFRKFEFTAKNFFATKSNLHQTTVHNVRSAKSASLP